MESTEDSRRDAEAQRVGDDLLNTKSETGLNAEGAKGAES